MDQFLTFIGFNNPACGIVGFLEVSSLFLKYSSKLKSTFKRARNITEDNITWLLNLFEFSFKI
ncbi:4695_t:CDS:1, partial [Funneliformis caledonium]